MDPAPFLRAGGLWGVLRLARWLPLRPIWSAEDHVLEHSNLQLLSFRNRLFNVGDCSARAPLYDVHWYLRRVCDRSLREVGDVVELLEKLCSHRMLEEVG